MNKHKLYILYTGIFCKVGVTARSVEKRYKEIQTNCPLPIYKYSYIDNLSKADAFFIESKLKTHLLNHVVISEWYREFDGIVKSISFLMQEHSQAISIKLKTVITNNKKFDDLSIKKLNEINEARKNYDLTKLSRIYSQFANNKQYHSANFFMYPKREILKVLENAIGLVINHYRKNKLNIDKNIEETLIKNHKVNNDKHFNFIETVKVPLSRVREVNFDKKYGLSSNFFDRISKEIEDGNLS